MNVAATRSPDDTQVRQPVIVDRADFQSLFDALAQSGYSTMGPTVRDGAIVYDQIQSVDDLPAGWTDDQDGGHYRLRRRSDQALFGFAVGPHSWKKFLYPTNHTLWKGVREGASFSVASEPEPQQKLAFVGVRSCELHAIAIQDRVFQVRVPPNSGLQSDAPQVARA